MKNIPACQKAITRHQQAVMDLKDGGLTWKQVGERLDDLVGLLGDRPYFFGDQLSRADLSVSGMLHTGLSGPTPEFNQLLAERPALAQHLERVLEATKG